MARQETAKTIINRVAGELGLGQSPDPYASSDMAFTQLTALLNAAGQELSTLHEWQSLRSVKEFTTTTDSTYTLPTDFDRIVNQTFYDLTNDVPVQTLSTQQWSVLEGAGLGTDTIYASFRMKANALDLWPDPMTAGLSMRYEYISRSWATDEDGAGIDFTTEASDIVLLDPLLVQKFTKLKFLQAKNLDSRSAAQEFENIFLARTGQVEASPILNAACPGNGFRLLGAGNVPDTGYGA